MTEALDSHCPSIQGTVLTNTAAIYCLVEDPLKFHNVSQDVLIDNNFHVPFCNSLDFFSCIITIVMHVIIVSILPVFSK